MDFYKTNTFKFLIAFVIFALLAFISLYFILTSSVNKQINQIDEKINAIEIPVFKESINSEIKSSVYTLKEFNGKLGVFKDGDFQYQIDIYVFSLPDNDKKLLLQGINVTSEQELNDIISCYY